MSNKKTTIAGYISLAGAVLYLIASVLTGSGIDASVGAVIAALGSGGIGLISASDGGH